MKYMFGCTLYSKMYIAHTDLHFLRRNEIIITVSLNCLSTRHPPVRGSVDLELGPGSETGLFIEIPDEDQDVFGDSSEVTRLALTCFYSILKSPVVTPRVNPH